MKHPFFSNGEALGKTQRLVARAGFTLMELMVSLGVFSIFLYVSSGFWGQMVRSGGHEQRLTQAVNQTARLALDYLSRDIQRVGAGQLFAPQVPTTSPGYALIPANVTSSYGQKGILPISGNGGPDAADEITFVYSDQSRLARVMWDHPAAGRIRLDFQLRDDTPYVPNAAKIIPIAGNSNPYPFFTGFFSPVLPSPYSPANWDPSNTAWPGTLLLIKTSDNTGSEALDVYGQQGQRSTFRVVRVNGIQPAGNPPPPADFPFTFDVTYQEERQNPFNRWLLTLEGTSGTDKVYFETAKMFPHFQQREKDNNDPTSKESGPPGAMLGCGIRSKPSDPLRACSTAMQVSMRTYFVVPPGTVPVNPDPAAPPILAMIPYTQAVAGGAVNYNLAQDAVSLADGVEDLQVEYFLGRGITPISPTAQTTDANPGVNDLSSGAVLGNGGYWASSDNVPKTHFVLGLRLGIAASRRVFFDKPSTAAAEQNADRLLKELAPPNVPTRGYLRRINRQFVALRNMYGPYAPAEGRAIVVR